MSVVDRSTGSLPSTLDDVARSAASMSHAQRRAAGAAHRSEVPLDQHAQVPDPAERAEPIAVLTSQDGSRLPELVPIRHGRMSASAFTFYRGAAAVMASDLSSMPSTGLHVQLCGDAHLSNFGLFNGPDRRLVFDLNDFDETLPGPFEWDVKRLAASLVVAARDNGLPDDKADRAALAALAGYRTTMSTVAEADPLELHYYRLELDEIIDRLEPKDRQRTAKAASKARSKNSLKAFAKLTDEVDGRRRIIDDPPLVTRLDVLEDSSRDDIRRFFDDYLATLPLARRRVLQRYRLIDVAHKVVGVGSVGTRCFILLCETGDGDPLFLQLKEATASVLEPYLGASEHPHAGQRVVEGQRLMQAAGDVFLGWARFHILRDDRSVDFYLRQLWDGKASAAIENYGPRRLRGYGEVCGAALALAHARSGDAATISGYLGDDDTFDRAIVEFATAYADITERDHEQHLAAIARGEITVLRDL